MVGKSNKDDAKYLSILSKYVKTDSHYLLVQDANTISLYYDHDFAKALEIGNPEYISSLSCQHFDNAKDAVGSLRQDIIEDILENGLVSHDSNSTLVWNSYLTSEEIELVLGGWK